MRVVDLDLELPPCKFHAMWHIDPEILPEGDAKYHSCQPSTQWHLPCRITLDHCQESALPVQVIFVVFRKCPSENVSSYFNAGSKPLSITRCPCIRYPFLRLNEIFPGGATA